jgi:hypothetical protein
MDRAQEIHKKFYSGILEGTGQLGHLHIEYNIKIHIQEMKCEDMNCVYLVQGRKR